MSFLINRTLLNKQQNLLDWRGKYTTSPTAIPLDFSGLKLWLRAGRGITLNNGNVSFWADQSDKNRNATQSTSANQPLFVSEGLNGHDCISFPNDDTTDHWLDLGDSGGDSELEVFAYTVFAIGTASQSGSATNCLWSTRFLTEPSLGEQSWYRIKFYIPK